MTQPFDDAAEPGDADAPAAEDPTPRPPDLRQVATHFLIGVVLTVAVLFVAGASNDGLRTVLLLAAPVVALISAFALLWRTYRVWRARGRWQVWQGGAWLALGFFIFVLFATAPSLMA